MTGIENPLVAALRAAQQINQGRIPQGDYHGNETSQKSPGEENAGQKAQVLNQGVNHDESQEQIHNVGISDARISETHQGGHGQADQGGRQENGNSNQDAARGQDLKSGSAQQVTATAPQAPDTGKKTRSAFTDAERDRLAAYMKQGMPPKQIALNMERPIATIRKKMHEIESEAKTNTASTPAGYNPDLAVGVEADEIVKAMRDAMGTPEDVARFIVSTYAKDRVLQCAQAMQDRANSTICTMTGIPTLLDTSHMGLDFTDFNGSAPLQPVLREVARMVGGLHYDQFKSLVTCIAINRNWRG